MEIHYQNVGSIRHAQVEFKPGSLVAIVGETNQGKSLMFYSLVAGFTNSPDFKKYLNNDAVKEDAKAVEKVALYDDFGNFWQAEASKNHFYFRTNRAKFEKTNRKSIFELAESQIPGLFYDPENLTPILNIVDEDSGLFPIDRSDAQIFKTYERLLSLSCTEDILRSIKLDLDDIDFKITELSNGAQQNTEYLAKLDKLYNSVNQKDLSIVKDTLLRLKKDYDTSITTYKSIDSIVNYVDKVLEKGYVSDSGFNVQYFESLLKDYIKAVDLQKYVDLKEKTFEKEDFNIAKAVEIAQDYSVAYQLSTEIAQLTYEISVDESTLQGILLKLKDIKTCPLCGKPMEDCND